MPSLDDILKDMLVISSAKRDPSKLTQIDPGQLTLAGHPNPQINGPESQPIWFWSYTNQPLQNGDMPMNKVTDLEVWSRDMAIRHNDKNMGWMTVAKSIEWAPITIEFAAETVQLPLTKNYFVRGYFLKDGQNDGTNPMWPTVAELDQSFIAVFAYNLTARMPSASPARVTQEELRMPNFMPQPGFSSGTTRPGTTLLIPNDRRRIDDPARDNHYVCVVISLACMKERADFEPLGLVSMARFIPHTMIMSNKTLERTDPTLQAPKILTQAQTTITRPDQSGYHGSWNNPGGRPRIMAHADMNPSIGPLFVTDTNATLWTTVLQNGVPLPYWDILFEYTLAPSSGAWMGTFGGGAGRTVVVDPGKTKTRRKANAWKGIRYAGRRAPLRDLQPLPVAYFPYTNPREITKVPRQGSFDSMHLAPSMKAVSIINDPIFSRNAANMDSLAVIKMAPVCEHDCMHTHWRWGKLFEDMPGIDLQILKGFGPTANPKFKGTGQPTQVVGSPMVPLNQQVEIGTPRSRALDYLVTINPITAGVWQPVYHHGSAYPVAFTTKGKAAMFLQKQMISNSQDSAEFYWNLQYQSTRGAPVVRLNFTDVELVDAMNL